MASIWNDMKSGYGAAKAGYSDTYNRLNKSYMGRSFVKGVHETFGFNYDGIGTGSKYQGFLNTREIGTNFEKTFNRSAGSIARMRKSQGAINTSKYVLKKTYQKQGLKGLAGIGEKALGGSVGLVLTAVSAYSAYQEEGMWGAAKDIGSTIAMQAGMSAIFGGIGMATNLAGVAAIGYGAYRLGEAGNEYRKGLQQLEFGGSFMADAIGSAGAATSRQRAVMALQNTHLNGRMALGNEASVLHGISSYR